MSKMAMFVLMIFFSTVANSACNYSKGLNSVLSFEQVATVEPESVNGEYMTRVKNACLGEREISSWLTESANGVVTSSLKPFDNREFFYITTFNPEENVSRLMAVAQLNNGKLQKKTLIDGSENFSNPEESLHQMLIDGYDPLRRLIYFSVPAWVTSDAIHIFKVPAEPSAAFGNIKQKFLVAGNFKYLNLLSTECESCLVVTEVRHDDDGAYFPLMMYDWNGKFFCQLDNRASNYGDMKCLPPGTIYKPR